MGRVKNELFNNIEDMDYLDEDYQFQEWLWQQDDYKAHQELISSAATKKAAKAASKDIAEEIIIDDEPSNTNDDEYGFPL